MKNFKLVSLMAMAGLFLFLGGCQKEILYELNSPKNSASRAGYHPVFDTLRLSFYSNARNSDSLILLSPTTTQLRNMSTHLMQVPHYHSLAKKAVQLKRNGDKWDTNLSVIYGRVNEDQYIITIPFTRQGKVTAIFLYLKQNDRFQCYLYNISEIMQQMTTGNTDIQRIGITYLATNALFVYKKEVEKDTDISILQWIMRHHNKMQASGSGRRCEVTTFYYPEITFQLIGSTEHIKVREGTIEFVWCDTAHDHNGYIGSGEAHPEDIGGNAGSNGLSQADRDMIVKFAGLDTECLSLLLPEMKDDLLNATSPCDPDNFVNKVMQAFNDACTKAKQDGCDNFLQNIEMWEFSEAIKNALDGVDYVNQNQKEKLILMLDGTGEDIRDLCDDAPNYELNSCEEKLIEKYGNSAKMGLFASKKIAEKWASLKFNTLGHNDCLDAFRHAMFNANNAFYLGSGVAKEFGDAHECDNDPDEYFEGVMDLHNNAMGITIYNYLPKNPNGSIPSHILADEICKRMQNGDLKVFSDPNNNQSPLIPSHNCNCN